MTMATLEHQTDGAATRQSAAALWRGRLIDRASLIIPCVMLAALLAVYGTLREGVFTIDELNLDTAAAKAAPAPSATRFRPGASSPRASGPGPISGRTA